MDGRDDAACTRRLREWIGTLEFGAGKSMGGSAIVPLAVEWGTEPLLDGMREAWERGDLWMLGTYLSDEAPSMALVGGEGVRSELAEFARRHADGLEYERLHGAGSFYKADHPLSVAADARHRLFTAWLDQEDAPAT